MTLKCPVCETTAVSLEDSNGVTDPSKDRFEYYECERGHGFTFRLAGEKA